MLKATQNTLFLLGVIAVVIAPHAPQLPTWCTALVLVVLLWRAWIAYKGWALPKRWVILLALVGCIWATFSSHKTLLGPGAGTTLVVALLTLKTLEMRAQRDVFVVFYLGFFVLIVNFLESQSLGVALAMVVGMAGLLTSLVNAQLMHESAGLKAAGWQALKLMLLGAPLMIFLFVFFPRVAPLWALPNLQAAGRTGLSDDMTVGRIAQLAKNDDVALRVKFEGATPAPSQMYFRGPVLSHFDGETWRPSSIRPPRVNFPEALVKDAPVRYEVTLEPNEHDWLMTLDLTPQQPDLPGEALVVSSDFQWFSAKPNLSVVRYKAVSYSQYAYGLELTEAQLRESLYLPKNINPRIQALGAEQLKDPVFQVSSVAGKVNWVVAQLASGGYRYTLEPGVYGRHSADEFWFDRKEGFCEHFAATFVIMMRAMGVPARVVTGYQGGELNAVDGFWTVRQSDAHAWAEVWMAPGSAEGQGWVRVDPTSAVAPSRVESAQRLETPRGPVGTAVNQFLGGQGVNWLMKMRSLWEASENLWIQKVLNFSRDQQFEFLKNFGFEAPDEQTLGQVMAGIILLGLLLFGGFGKARQWRWWALRRLDPWQRLWEQVKADALARGLAVDATTTPRQLAMQIRQQAQRNGLSDDPKVEAATRWLIRYEALRYAPMPRQATGGNNPMAGTLALMQREWKALRFKHET